MFKNEGKKECGEITVQEYLEWFVDHEIDCIMNHDGSPHKMETDGIEEIYMRSLDKHNIRYRPFIGDGDSASYTHRKTYSIWATAPRRKTRMRQSRDKPDGICITYAVKQK